jgi:hypothetical protein
MRTEKHSLIGANAGSHSRLSVYARVRLFLKDYMEVVNRKAEHRRLIETMPEYLLRDIGLIGDGGYEELDKPP